jgi:hypothetical protein
MKEPIVILESIDPAAIVEVAPGERYGLTDLVAKSVATPAKLKAPPYAICRMVRLGNGDYRPVPVEWSTWVPATSSLAKRLGANISRKTLQRLWLNGYIEMRQTSPHIIELNLESLVAHLRAVHDDPDFWSRPATDGTPRTRRAAYVAEIA